MALIQAQTAELPKDRLLFLYKQIASGTAGEQDEIKFEIFNSPSEMGFALMVTFPNGETTTETVDLLPEIKSWIGSMIAKQAVKDKLAPASDPDHHAERFTPDHLTTEEG